MRNTGDDGRVTVTNDGHFLRMVPVVKLDRYLTEIHENNQPIVFVWEVL